MLCHICGNEKLPNAYIPCECPRPIRSSPLLPLTATERFEAVDLKKEEATRNSRFRVVWRKLHQNTNHTIEWFNAWKLELPKMCGCNYDEAFIAVPIRPDDWFTWSVNLHNWVNRKLKHKEINYDEAMVTWLLPPSKVVTSLSLLPHHVTVQQEAISSWEKLDLKITSVNLETEILALSTQYPTVNFVVSQVATGDVRPVPTINSLITQALDEPTLLINSDCVLRGSKSLLQPMSVFIRHNWNHSVNDATREQWGLDAFTLTPALAKTIPILPFGIGQPMWDYWIAWHLQQHCDLNWMGDPFLYHKNHTLNWTPEQCGQGRQWVRDHYKVNIDWAKWREEQPYAFNEFKSETK